LASGVSLASSSSHTMASFALSSRDEPGGYLWQASALEAFAKPERRLQVCMPRSLLLTVYPCVSLTCRCIAQYDPSLLP
jgi:hypothetical protein